MTFSNHYRNSSPSGGRHHVAGPRASTGMVQLGSSVDPYEQPRHFYNYDDYPSDAGYASTAYKHYPMRRSPVEARPVSTSKIHDHGHSAKRRTEYTIEPQSQPSLSQSQQRHRSRSNTASAVDIYQNPARLSVPSHHGSGYGQPHSPVATSSGQYLAPGSHHGSRHRRVYSNNDYASDTGRLDSHDHAKHRSSRHRSHRDAPPSSRRRHPDYESIKKGEDIDRYDAYSYTTPREQFDRDYPVRPRRHVARTSLDRPVSMTVMEDHPQWLSRKDRSHGPPPTSRGFDKLDQEGRPRSTRGNDDYHHRETSRSRGGNDRSLVVMPHDSDDGYESYGDHRRHRRHREHRSHHESDRRHREDRSPRPHDNGANDRALVGLGTAALGNGYSDISDYDRRQASRQHRRSRDPERDYDATQSTSRELIERPLPSSDTNKQIYLEPVDPRMRHRSRSRRHSRRRRDNESDGLTDDDDLRRYQREPSASPRHRHSSEDTSEDNHPASRHRPPRQRSTVRSPSRSRSPSNDSKDGGKKVVAVDPPAQKEPELVPKGILKKPRPAFPEEPNPVREGVAPLKDAEKNGIPPGARWTKIDRRLVNPGALRLAGERFEEREEYVIVLKVLSKEEIQQLAVATQAIRDARQKESTRDRRERRDKSQRDGHHGDSTSSDDEFEDDEDHRREPLQIEAPPASRQSPQNSTLPERPRVSSHSLHGNEKARVNQSTAQA
ncbi:hypothetical protein N7478_005476 [Penicillium angulare]|uniref:uncharacterized protein n=1 Tax=Penicillium angulare TaxID=116970 RepID=UPI00254042AA|nr:uncharacterized protein N7478_005476 [Penicillium angulare]KAJ5280104.1 hypothetical protein N7478_005476 [Penicillium angulare]